MKRACLSPGNSLFDCLFLLSFIFTAKIEDIFVAGRLQLRGSHLKDWQSTKMTVVIINGVIPNENFSE